MARVLMTSVYKVLKTWPGRLFEASGAATSVTDPGLFVWTHASDSSFPNFEVRITGSGFT